MRDKPPTKESVDTARKIAERMRGKAIEPIYPAAMMSGKSMMMSD